MIDVLLIVLTVSGIGWGVYKHTQLKTLLESVVPKTLLDTVRTDIDLLRTDFVKAGAEFAPLLAKMTTLTALAKPIVDDIRAQAAAAAPPADVPTLTVDTITVPDPVAELDKVIADATAKKKAIAEKQAALDAAHAELAKVIAS